MRTGWVPVALGVAALAEVLLALTALQKLASPRPAVRALRGAGLPASRLAVRAGATVEAIAAVGALVSGRPWFTAVVAACYLGFAAFIAVGLARPGRVTSCGCLGEADIPPTRGHLVFDVAAAVVCLAATVRPVPGLAQALSHQPVSGIPLVGLVAVGVYLAWTFLSVAPQTAAARLMGRGR